MFRQTTIFCIATLMVLSAVFYSQAQEDDLFVTSPAVEAPQPPGVRVRIGYKGDKAFLLWERIQAAQHRLTKAEDEEAKQEAIAEIREALPAYSDLDLERRQSELAAIKKRVAEMEGQLKKRVDAKEDIIALRLQVLLNDADGLGWSYDSFKEKPGVSPFERSRFGSGSYSETAVPTFRNAVPTSTSIAPPAESPF